MYGVIRYEDENINMVEDLGDDIEKYLVRLRAYAIADRNMNYEIFIRHMGRTYFYFNSITKELFRK